MPTPNTTPTPAAAAPAAAPAAAAPAATVVPPAETDEFGDAFAALSNEGTDPAQAAAAPAAGDPAAAAAPAAGDPAAAPAAPAESASEIATLKAQLETMNARMAELVEAAKPAPAAPAPEQPVPVYTADEQAIIDNYRKEWADVAAGEALVRRAEYQQVVKYIFDQIGPQLQALSESNQVVTTRSQYTDIVGLVPDYDEVRDLTLAWVDKQPDYLKKAYQEVANTGTPADVADLIARFKRETNYVPPGGAPATPAATPAAAAPAAAPTATPAAPVKPAAPALPAAAAAAVASLKLVKSSRTEPAAPEGAEDFEGAFKEFAAK